MSDWLELELADGLSRRAAPEDLWNRIQRPPHRPALRGWPIAAVVTLILAAGALWFAAKGQVPPPAPVHTAHNADAGCLLCHTTL